MKLNEMKYVDNAVSYNKMVNYINFVVDNSFDENGKYHQYKYDYVLAVALIAMYTDYTDNAEFDEVMEFIHTDVWYSIVKQMGHKYEIFKHYTDCEIENATRPFAFANETLSLVKNTLVQFNQFLSAIDVEKLKNYDFTEILNAIDAITGTDTTKVENNTDKTEDNIVQFNNIENKDNKAEE